MSKNGNGRVLLVVTSKDGVDRAVALHEGLEPFRQGAVVLSKPDSGRWLWAKLASGMLQPECVLFVGQDATVNAGWGEHAADLRQIANVAHLGKVTIQYCVAVQSQPFERPTVVSGLNAGSGHVVYGWLPDPEDPWWERDSNRDEAMGFLDGVVRLAESHA